MQTCSNRASPQSNPKLIKPTHITSFSLPPTKAALLFTVYMNRSIKRHAFWVCVPKARLHNNCICSVTHTYKKTHTYFLLSCSVDEWHVFFSSAGLPQLSVVALWQSSTASSSAQASRGITKAAWTVAGEFNSQLALVCRLYSAFPFHFPLFSSLFCSSSSDIMQCCFLFFSIVRFMICLIIPHSSCACF